MAIEYTLREQFNCLKLKAYIKNNRIRNKDLFYTKLILDEKFRAEVFFTIHENITDTSTALNISGRTFYRWKSKIEKS